jgi:ABC-type polysaccharide/polyol phosphate export permease
MKQAKFAFQDFIDAAFQFRVWSTLGWLEVRQRYQRSVLGPWWLSISMLVFIFVLGTVFGRLFSVDYNTYIPYFSTGYLLWLYISACIVESTDLFKQNSGFIKQIKLPYSIYVFKFLTKNIIIFGHNFLVYLLILWYFQIPVGWTILCAIPGFIFLSLNLYWVSLCIALISTRFRDMVPIINSCVQILFFVTPISWNRQLLADHSKIIQWNPIVYFLDIVREPLLGRLPSLHSWVVVLSATLLGAAVGLVMFSKSRSRIPFWVD